MNIPKLSIKMIANDSKWGPWYKQAKTIEEKDHVCDLAQQEWDGLHNNSGRIRCTIITAFGCYEL